MSWPLYLLLLNIYLIIFYGFYRLVLAKETFFSLNRIYLLSAGLCSLLIPFVKVDWMAKQQITEQVYIQVSQASAMMGASASVVPEENTLNWGLIISMVYLFGAMVFFIHFVIKLFLVNKMFVEKKPNVAFSFWKKKVVQPNLPEAATINHHEDIHIKQLHTFDVIFFEVLAIVTWFNPIIYLFKKEIKNVHEYLADNAVVQQTGNKEAYAYLLLNQSFGLGNTSVISGFSNKSMVKKRIFMLYKEKSKKVAILKYGIALPLFGLALVISSATLKNNDEIKAISEEIKITGAKEMVTDVLLDKKQEIAERADDKYSKFYKFLADNVKYPKEALSKNIQGNVVANFIVYNHKITSIVIKPTLGYGFDEGVKQVLRTFNADIFNNGKYSIKFEHRLSGANSPILNEQAQAESGYTKLNTITIMGYSVNEDDKIHSFVSMEHPPQFNGGMAQFYRFLSNNIRYPEAASAADISGNVFVSFVVDKDGSVKNIKIDRGLGYGTDEEAVRVLSISPKWQPGTINGKAVTVKYNLPIKFALGKDKNQPKPIFIVDDKEVDNINLIKRETIGAVEVVKGEEAVKRFGEKGKNGAVVITTKPVTTQPADSSNPNLDEEKVYSFVSMETPPSYPGGIEKFYKFLGENIKYPAEAFQNNIQGNVFVSFTVEKDGSLTDIKIDRPLGHGTDEEAVRVLKLSRRWNPGVQKGKVVRVKYNIPIKFSLKK